MQEICQTQPNAIWINQYPSPANPQIHYTTTGPEIYRQMHGNVDVLFLAVSTSGTLAGIGRYFCEVSPRTRVIAADAMGSVAFGTPPGPRKLTGISSFLTSSFITTGLYDEHILVGDAEAFTCCRALEQATAINVGGSSRAVLSACVRSLATHPQLTDVFCVCPDGGDNYARTIFNDAWLHEQHFDHNDLPIDPGLENAHLARTVHHMLRGLRATADVDLVACDLVLTQAGTLSAAYTRPRYLVRTLPRTGDEEQVTRPFAAMLVDDDIYDQPLRTCSIEQTTGEGKGVRASTSS